MSNRFFVSFYLCLQAKEIVLAKEDTNQSVTNSYIPSIQSDVLFFFLRWNESLSRHKIGAEVSVRLIEMSAL